MSTDTFHTPQYRPSYGSYMQLPESQSIPSIQAAYDSIQSAHSTNCPPRYPPAHQQPLPSSGTPSARTNSIQTARRVSRPPPTKYSGWAASYLDQDVRTSKRDRRQTTTTLPNQPLYSAPTIASSSLTASASTNDLSQPALVPRFHQQVTREALCEKSSSRIPTPSYDATHYQGRRYVSTPVLPSEQKENIKDGKPRTLRLLGPVSPTSNSIPPIITQKGTIPKSRTFNMISSLTSSLSRSTLSSSRSRQSPSVGSTRISDLTSSPAKPTLSHKATASAAQPVFTTTTRQVAIAQPHSYWCGRFRALQDRFTSDEFQLALKDPMRTNKDCCNGDEDSEGDATTLYKRVFIHLEALCITKEARQSLWEYQQAFARNQKNERLLPVGGRMVEKNEWVRRLSKVLGESYGNGRSDIAGVAGLGFKAGKIGRPKANSLGGQRQSLNVDFLR